MPNADRLLISLSTRSPTEMQVMLPAYSDRYSASDRAISFPRDPGGLTSTILSTEKSNGQCQYKSLFSLTFRLFKFLN